jgi:phosphohistidine phosphatase
MPAAMDPFRFYLVRHGDAEPAGSAGDAGRRLTPEGRARFQALLRARAADLRVARILTSPLQRARETAALLAAQVGAPVEEEPALAAGRSIGPELLALAKQAGPGTALVGHNPEIAEAVVLAAAEAHQIAPGTVAAIDSADGIFRLAWIDEG